MHIQAPNSLTCAVSEANFEGSVMGCENEPYLDEDGEPLVALDKNVGSEGNDRVQHVLDVSCTNRSERIPTPVRTSTNSKGRKLIIKTKSGKESVLGATTVYDNSKSKGRKLLIKLKPAKESGSVDLGLGGDDVSGMVRGDHSDGRKMKKMDKGENRRSMGKGRKAEKGEIKSQVKKRGRRGTRDDMHSEIKEMWEAVAGGNFEDGEDGVRTVYEEHLPRRGTQAKEGKFDSEIEELFKFGKKKKKKKETDPAKTLSLVEIVVAELEVAAEEDARLNRQQKPAITKLRNLSLLTDIIPRKHLQQEFIDRGGLSALRKWLEPVSDGSLPNITVRAAVFKCLNDLSINLERDDRRQLLIDCGIGRALMFYYRWNEETIANCKLLKELVEKWSRAIFEISTNYEDMKNNEVKRTYKRPPLNKVTSNGAAGGSKDNDLDFPELSLGGKSGPSSSRQHTSRPVAMPMDFMVRPASKVDPEAVRTQAKQTRWVKTSHRAKLCKKLEKMKALKSKQLQAVKLSCEGRGMLKLI